MTAVDNAPSATTPAPRQVDVHNPATGGLVGSVPIDSAATVAAKVAKLRVAQREWESMGPAGRRQWLLLFQDWILDHAEHLADVLQSETGKVRTEATIEAPMAADLLKYWANNAAEFLSDRNPKPHAPLGKTKRLTQVFRPYPVVGVITPWNFPFAMPALDVIPALSSGAAVLLKPSEVTPLSAVEFVRGWTEIGAPSVLDIATGYGETGAAVVDNVDYLQFTGSTKTGRVIAQQCASRLIPYSLELGGKDPAIVLADADLDRAAHGVAWGGLFNSGQVCVSIERVYVEASVHDEFVEKLVANVKALRQGNDDRGYKYDVGALATEGQRDIVSKHVNEAIAAGAVARTGGEPTGVGTFFEPTVLTGVDQSMSCIREETFGPTIPVVKVADADEAVRLANDSEYGLSATVWTGDAERGEQIARRLEVGAVNINDALANLFSFALPMGGWKESGIGARWGGAAGILKYCRVQAITAPRIPVQEKEMLWYPYSKRASRMAVGIMRAANGRGLRKFRRGGKS